MVSEVVGALAQNCHVVRRGDEPGGRPPPLELTASPSTLELTVSPGLPPGVEELYRGFDRLLKLERGLHQSKDEIRRALAQGNVGTGIPDNKLFQHIVTWGRAQGHTITTTKPSSVGGTRVPHLLGVCLREIPF
jgi:hypothetical protein